MAQVAMAWVINNPVVSAPIVGATKAHHLTDAAAAVELQLTDEEIDSLQDDYTPRQPTYFN
jgi:1-deoxyxylulose-5-phosphate synthase